MVARARNTAIAIGALAVAASCAQFSAGECTDKALCAPTNDATVFEAGGGDAPIDVIIEEISSDPTCVFWG